jgi:hypothetical protein
MAGMQAFLHKFCEHFRLSLDGKAILMKRRNLLKEYGSRLIRKTLVQATGGLGFVVAAILQILFPHVLIWAFYLIILVTGLVVGSYFVFVDLVKDSEAKENEYKHKIGELELKVSELEDAQPRITVGFQDAAHRSVKAVQLQLRPLPPKPDFDALVEDERKQLPPESRSLGRLTVAGILSPRNPDYREEVEQYLTKYRDYLVKRYERKVAEDRTRFLVPIIENQGHYPANNVTIEFEMPGAYRQPEKHQICETEITEEDLEGLEGSEQVLREVEDKYICGLPKKPKPFIDTLRSSMATLWADPRWLSPSLPSAQIQRTPNVSGPVHEDRDGVHYIVYHVQQLVQHRPEDEFEPFFLWLGDVRHPVVWKIPVTITSADLREPLQEVLQLRIGITEETESASQTVHPVALSGV